MFFPVESKFLCEYFLPLNMPKMEFVCIVCNQTYRLKKFNFEFEKVIHNLFICWHYNCLQSFPRCKLEISFPFYNEHNKLHEHSVKCISNESSLFFCVSLWYGLYLQCLSDLWSVTVFINDFKLPTHDTNNQKRNKCQRYQGNFWVANIATMLSIHSPFCILKLSLRIEH